MDDIRSLFTPTSVRGPCGVIAHALGGIDGLAYLNCREGFLATCRAGYRLVEADFGLTADGRVVCYHEVEDKLGLKRPLAEVPYADFMSRRFEGKYTPIDLEGLLRQLTGQEWALRFELDSSASSATPTAPAPSSRDRERRALEMPLLNRIVGKLEGRLLKLDEGFGDNSPEDDATENVEANGVSTPSE